MISKEKRHGSGSGIFFEGAIFSLLLLLCFYVNRHIHIKGLYMDDLYMWSCYGEQSFLEFVFPFRSSTRFRPVYWMLTYLEMLAVRNRPELFVAVNIILNAGIAYFIYRFSKRLSGGSGIIGILCGAMYIFSHFSYYQIAQALGLLETMSLFLALLILYLIFRYISEKKLWLFLSANAVCFLLAFSHERYIALFPLLYLAAVALYWDRGGAGTESGRARSRGFLEKGLLLLLPAGLLLLTVLIRRLFIGTALPAGTGGTEVTETFSLYQALSFSVQQLMYIFGINVGPEYLSGISWADVKSGIRLLVFASWIPIGIILFCFIFASIRYRLTGNRKFLLENLLFLSFIALCIGCSSITIRVELRWIYVSYGAALLYLSYMTGRVAELLGDGESRRRYGYAREGGEKVLPIDLGREERRFGLLLKKRAMAAAAVLVMLYACLMAPVERYYRSYFRNIYFWENQDRMNSLAEETVGRYSVEGVLGKQVYILENSYEMSEFYGKTFFKVYDPERTAQGTEIHFISGIEELPENADRENSIVLREVPEERGYRVVEWGLSQPG